MKKLIAILCAAALLLALGVGAFASGEASGSREAQPTRGDLGPVEVPETAGEWIQAAFSTKSFTDEAVPDEVMTAILQAGINAPSAQNKQPCKFILVEDEALRSAIARTPAAVIVAVPEEDYTGGGNSQFAAGLAAESMYLYAQAEGLGAHMYTAPAEMTINVSAESRAAYGIPEGYEAAVVIGFGYYADFADAYSAATVRNDYESFVTVLGGEEPEAAAEFVILHTNDTHGAIDGFPYLKAMKDTLLAEGDNVLLFDAGDTFFGENVATLTDGESIAETMNQVAYDAMVLGNDDTTRGVETVSAIADMLDFPALAANYFDLEGNVVVPGYVLIECGGYRFGVFGVTDKIGEEKAVMTGADEAAAECVAALEAEGADVIIALTHLGVGEQYSATGSESLAAAVPGIDIIIDGHSHTELPQGLWVNDTLIVQTGEHFANIGRIDLGLNEDGSIAYAKASLIPEAEFTALTPDPDAQAVANAWLDSVSAYTSEVLCALPYRMNADRPDIRCMETNLGDLMADVLRAETDADMALVPGFFIRSSVEAGDFTRGDVLNVLANGGDFIVYRATGAYILSILEKGLSSVPEQNPDFRHVSGITVEFDSSKEAGSRVVSVTLDNGEALDPEGVYTFANGTAMSQEGDGCEIIGQGDDLQEFMMEYLASGSAVFYEGPAGRVVDLNG